MTTDEVMERLERLGSEQTRKIYARHGVGGEQFGVSYADLKALEKELKTDHALALSLWETGNHDARVLATLIADPGALGEAVLERLANDLDSYPLADAFGGLVGKTPHAQMLMTRWTQDEGEWRGQVGWNLLSGLAATDRTITDADFAPYLKRIENGVHTRKNRVRHAMNGALINIGARSPALEKQARAVAQAVGKVEVDHGQTNCVTPDAASYLNKVLKRKGHLLVG